MEMRHSVIETSTAARGGGGLALVGATATIFNSTIQGCVSHGGGAALVGPGARLVATLAVFRQRRWTLYRRDDEPCSAIWLGEGWFSRDDLPPQLQLTSVLFDSDEDGELVEADGIAQVSARAVDVRAAREVAASIGLKGLLPNCSDGTILDVATGAQARSPHNSDAPFFCPTLSPFRHSCPYAVRRRCALICPLMGW